MLPRRAKFISFLPERTATFQKHGLTTQPPSTLWTGRGSGTVFREFSLDRALDHWYKITLKVWKLSTAEGNWDTKRTKKETPPFQKHSCWALRHSNEKHVLRTWSPWPQNSPVPTGKHRRDYKGTHKKQQLISYNFSANRWDLLKQPTAHNYLAPFLISTISHLSVQAMKIHPSIPGFKQDWQISILNTFILKIKQSSTSNIKRKKKITHQ